MVQELSERAAKVHAGIVDASTDNMLKITSDGRKLGLDQRVINPDLPDDPNSKVNRCVDNIHRIWQDGQADKLTQLVFCDLSTPKGKAAQSGRIAAKGTDSPELHALEAAIDAETEPEEPPFTIYDDIREKLVARGIPREQIAFIHEANTEVRKKELFAKVRSGQVRVLMGSTFKMGAGMNVQARGAPRPRLPVAAGRSGAAQRAHHPAGQPQQGGTYLPLCHGIHIRRLPLADGGKQAEIHLPDHDLKIPGEKL